MAKIHVFHNPSFLNYRGEHAQILLPVKPVALVNAPKGLSPAEMLEFAFMKTQHGHDDSWYNNPEVIAYLRSTSVGDLITDAEGNLHVVEAFGFQRYQPEGGVREAGGLDQRLAEAHRLLTDAVGQANTSGILSAARQALDAVQQALSASSYAGSETSVQWEDAQPGDQITLDHEEQFRVIARRLQPRQRAERLLVHIPKGQIRPDGEQAWAVLAPVDKEMNP